MELTQRLQQVRHRIASAQERSIYKQDISLIAVTKTLSVATLEEAYKLGLRDFGENRVQELLSKKTCLPEDIAWHLIGPLQTNKVKSVLGNTVLIHSLDRTALADELEKRASEKALTSKVLIEVNVAREENKHGISTNEVMDFVEYVATKEHLNVLGLMTVAPYADNPEEIRWVFQELHTTFLKIKELTLPNITMQILSMGMTNDFEIAIEEGANMVRIGSGIFGNR